MSEENFHRDELNNEIPPEELLKVKRVHPGDVVEGKVEMITSEGAILNIGTKEDAILPLEESDGLSVGDRIRVMVMRRNPEGTFIVSRNKLIEEEVLSELESSYREGKPIEAKVKSVVKGGFIVSIGNVLEGFVPFSEMDLRRVSSPDNFVGKSYLFKVKSLSSSRGRNIVLSRRAYLEEELKKKKKEALDKLEENKVVMGKVVEVRDYGAFVSLDEDGLLVGLLHRDNLSWGRRLDPRKLFKKGDKVEVMVLRVDKENQKIELSTKHLRPDPWETIKGKPYIETKYPVGSEVEATVVHLENYGAFVALDEDVEGLVHISEMSWGRRPRHPRDVLRVGDRVKVKVKGIQPETRRIDLSLKDVYPNPWVGAEDRYPVGSVVKLRVKKHEDRGVVVEFPDGIIEFIPYSEFPADMRISEIRKNYPPGSEVEAVVKSVDVENERISLSPGELEKRKLESKVLEEFPSGSVVEGKVVRIVGRGAIIDIGAEYSGFVPRNEISTVRFRDIRDVLSVGSRIKAKVLGFDVERKNLVLSIRAYEEEQQHKELEKYSREKAFTLGEILNLDELKKNLGGSR